MLTSRIDAPMLLINWEIRGAFRARSGAKATRSRMTATSPAPTIATGIDIHTGSPKYSTLTNPMNAPHIKIALCARLSTPNTLNTSA